MKAAWQTMVAAGVLAAAGAQAAPTVGECMELTTGVKFSKNNGDAQVNVEELFEGKKLKGTQLILDGGVLLATSYQDIRDGQVFLTGTVHYNEDGSVRSKNVYAPQSAIPAKMRPGQEVRVQFTDTQTSTHYPLAGLSDKITTSRVRTSAISRSLSSAGNAWNWAGAASPTPASSNCATSVARAVARAANTCGTRKASA